jgi:L-rhamnose 1-dehydrogenase
MTASLCPTRPVDPYSRIVDRSEVNPAFFCYFSLVSCLKSSFSLLSAFSSPVFDRSEHQSTKYLSSSFFFHDILSSLPYPVHHSIMTSLLRQKAVAITGAATGIGRATALACAKQGASLLLHHLGDARSTTAIKSLRSEIQSINPSISVADYGADITDPSAPDSLVASAVNALGRIDVLVNNAGICAFSALHDVKRDVVDRHLAVNTVAPFFLMQAATRRMKEQGGSGSVVNIASITASMGSGELAHYAATKAAVLGMTISGAVALGPDGVRVNSM